jgi:hypothetical protein
MIGASSEGWGGRGPEALLIAERNLGVGEAAAVRPDRQDAVLGLAEERGRAAQPAILDRILEHVEVALVVHRELAADLAGVLECKDLRETLVGVQGAVGIVRHAGRLGGIVDALEAEFLDEPVLECPVGPLACVTDLDCGARCKIKSSAERCTERGGVVGVAPNCCASCGSPSGAFVE